MFSKKTPPPAKQQAAQEAARAAGGRKQGSGIPSIISSDLRVLGNIVSQGVVDIDGIIEGNVKCQSVTIRKNGHIKGDVVAEAVHVYGTVQGLIKARSAHFFRGCRAEGVIMHESITIEDGAFVDGRFKRIENLDLEEETKSSSRIDEAPAIAEEKSAFTAPSFAMQEEDEAKNKTSEASAAAIKKGVKSQKQESVLDNLRLISSEAN